MSDADGAGCDHGDRGSPAFDAGPVGPARYRLSGGFGYLSRQVNDQPGAARASLVLPICAALPAGREHRSASSGKPPPRQAISHMDYANGDPCGFRLLAGSTPNCWQLLRAVISERRRGRE